MEADNQWRWLQPIVGLRHVQEIRRLTPEETMLPLVLSITEKDAKAVTMIASGRPMAMPNTQKMTFFILRFILAKPYH